MYSTYISSSPQVILPIDGRERRMDLIIWDARVALLQQAIEAKQDLRLSRIEQECSRMRRPSRKTIESRSILRLVNSSPIPDTKDVFSVQDRFDWLKIDRDKSEAYCVVCLSSENASRWPLLSPRGRSVVPNVETHSFSSTHKQLHDMNTH